MGSLGIYDETEYVPSSVKLCKKLKLSRKPLDDKDAVNHASVPRKIRSAMKRRGHELGNQSLAISSKQNRNCKEVGKPRKNGQKKSKLNMKPGQITKDEEEVAETLYALAGMFSEAAKTNKPEIDPKPKMKDSSTALETASAVTASEDTGLLTPGGDYMKIPVEAACHSSHTLDSSQVKLKSLEDSRHLEFLFNKQSPLSVSSGVQSNSHIGPRSWFSALGEIPIEQAIAPEQVVASGVKYFPMEAKCNGSFFQPSLSAGVTRSYETRESFPRNKLPAWFERANFSTQSCATKESASKNKLREVEPRMPWKRCSAHVHISRWIKVSAQTRDRNEHLPENPTQIGMDEQAELGTRRVQESLLQTQTWCSNSSKSSSSNKQCSDFLSLAAGGSGADASHGAGHGNKAVSYLQMQIKPAMFFSQPQNLSSLHGQPLIMTARQPPPYLSGALGSEVTAPTGHRWGLQQPKWTVPSSLQLGTTGVCTQYFPTLQHGEMDRPSLVDGCQDLFPDMRSVRSSKHHQLPQQKFGAISSRSLSNAMRGNHGLSLGLERDRDMSYPEKMPQMQLQLLGNRQRL